MISIIIPTYNEGSYIERTVKHLASLPRDQFEVIVSDSQSNDNTVALAHHAGADAVVELPMGKKRGISQGKNDGATVARGEFLVFIDADIIIPDPQAFFRDLLEQFRANPRLVGIVVPQWVEKNKETFADRIFFGILNWFYVFSNNILRSGNASGEFQMIKTVEFRKLHGFREDLVAGEDNDMFRRLSKIGRTRMYFTRAVYQSGRRVHTLGWPKTLFDWLKNGIYVAIFNKSPYKEWEAIR